MTMLLVSQEMGFTKVVTDRMYFFDIDLTIEACAPTESFTHSKEDRTKLFL